MADEPNAEQQAAQNKRKLEEHLARLKEGKVDFKKKARDGRQQKPKDTPKSPPIPPGWEAWKAAHKGRIHTLSGKSRERMAEEADYKLLELEPGAPKEEVRKAFNRLAKQYHPDLGGDPEIFQAMRAAHDRIVKGG